MKKFYIYILYLSVLTAGCAHEGGLVSVETACPVALRYALCDREQFYGTETVRGLGVPSPCIHSRKLAEVQNELQAKGWPQGLDAYRTIGAQKKMWGLCLTALVEDPEKGPDHCRGAAVDVTLVMPDGTELDMGTRLTSFLKVAPGFLRIPYKVFQPCPPEKDHGKARLSAEQDRVVHFTTGLGEIPCCRE